MAKNTSEIERIIEQERELVFDHFGCDDAYKIGTMLIEKARATDVVYSISVTLNRRQLFYFSMDGVTPDNDRWIFRKENTVYHFFRSSRRVDLEMQDADKTLSGNYGLNDAEYVAAGGCFPITVRGVGVVGTIAVSGLPSATDHAYVTDVIREYLGK